jgi:hypothetical protein
MIAQHALIQIHFMIQRLANAMKAFTEQLTHLTQWLVFHALQNVKLAQIHLTVCIALIRTLFLKMEHVFVNQHIMEVHRLIQQLGVSHALADVHHVCHHWFVIHASTLTLK